MTRACALALLIALAPAPGLSADRMSAAQDAVKSERDADARFLLARTLAWQGKFDQALDEYRTLLASEPGNADYRLGIGQVYVWRGAPADALNELAIARRLAPDYEQVWRSEITALELAGGEANLAQAAALRREAMNRFPRGDWAAPTAAAATPEPHDASLVVQPARDLATPSAPGAAERPRRSTVELAGSSEHLSNGSPNWQGIDVQLTHQIAERHLVAAALRETRRFGLSDTQLEVAYSLPLTQKLTGILEAGASPTHRVLPRKSQGATLQYEFAPAWLIHLGGKNTRYENDSVNQGTLMLEHYFSSFRLAAVWHPTRAFGATVHGGELRVDYYYGDHDSVGISVAAGEEAAAIDQRGVVISDVRAVGISGRHWMSPDWALRYDLGNIRQGDFYTRNGVRLGVQYAF
jgi:YaiO family outer membrane protein